MSNKRYDIQGVRGWAVIAVVLFHFFPSILPWGYLGVDVFFVLSGFLISLVLYEKPCAASTFIDFYFKRFKRIFPLALLVPMINLLVISRNDELKLLKFEARSALYALFFATNYNVRDEGEDYFQALEEANDYFTHYWSLSVEIQFYTLAPLLLHILKPSSSHPTRLLFYLSSLALASLVFSLSQPPEDAFSSTLCRLWQFLAGSMAFHLGKISSEQQHLPNKNSENIVKTQNIVKSVKYRKIVIPIPSVLLASMAILALADVSSLLRLTVTVAATILLVVQSTSPLLSHPHLQLLGDASYALYLLHWPVVCVLKEWEVQHPVCLIGAMALCIALSIAVHLTYEKWYLSLSEYSTVALVGSLYLLGFTMVFFVSTRKLPRLSGELDPAAIWEPGVPTNFTDAQVRQMNKLLEEQLEESLTIPNCPDRFKFCQFPSGLGNDSFLLIGNSFAFSPGKLVLKHFKEKYGKISIRAVSHCEPLIETKHHRCKNVHLAHRIFMDVVQREQPDVLFIATRYENPHTPIVGNVTVDPVYLFMFDKLKIYEKFVKKKVFILNSLPLLKGPIDVEKERLKKNLPIEGFMAEAIIADDSPMRQRTRELAKNCEKCVFFDIRGSHLNDKGQFMVVDPESKLHFFDKTVHYTSIGLKLIEPVFTQLSKEYEQLLKANYPDNIFELDRRQSF